MMMKSSSNNVGCFDVDKEVAAKARFSDESKKEEAALSLIESFGKEDMKKKKKKMSAINSSYTTSSLGELTHATMIKDSSNATLDAKEAAVKLGFAQLNDQELEAKSIKELIMNENEHENENENENENEKEISGVMITTTSSLDYAAARACISREKYVASRQEFLRGYKLKKKESVGRKTKKWLKDKKPQNPLRFILLLCVKLDVHP